MSEHRRSSALGTPQAKRLMETNAALQSEIERLQAENLKVSCHCAALISAMLDHGISNETIRTIAKQQTDSHERHNQA